MGPIHRKRQGQSPHNMRRLSFLITACRAALPNEKMLAIEVEKNWRAVGQFSTWAVAPRIVRYAAFFEEKQIPMVLYGRLDESIPVSLNVLEAFLNSGVNSVVSNC